MVMSDALRDATIANVPVLELKRLAVKEGMRTLRMAGNIKVLEGRTALEEIASNTMADELDSEDAQEPVAENEGD